MMPGRRIRQLGALTAALMLGFLATHAHADPIPPGWTAKNMEPVGYNALGGHGAAHKLVVKRHKDRWYIILGHFWVPGYSVVDVTDPTNPTYAKFIPAPANTRTTQVTTDGNLLIAGVNDEKMFKFDPKLPPGEAGTVIYDIRDPLNWKRLSYFPYPAGGNHRNYYPGGKYAYVAAGVPGYKERILVALDVSDPQKPKEAWRWTMPGQRTDEPKPDGPVGYHGPAMPSPDGKVLTLGYSPAVVNLDISDPSAPKLLGKLVMSPPFAEGHGGAVALHSALPLWDRDLIVALSENTYEDCEAESLHWIGLIDNKDKSKPRLISTLPIPVPEPGSGLKTFCDKAGRFGPHNIPMEVQSPGAEGTNNLLYVTWFNAGLRAFDISDPRLPREIGWFIPATPTVRTGFLPKEALETSVQDVVLDTRGYVYVTDYNLGMFVLRYTGPNPDKTAPPRRPPVR
jgi:hypothetical protein